MNITELDQYNLADAVKFHNRLNPKIWGADERLLPEVRSKLMEIAADFQEFLGLSDLDVQDITLSGSNAAYSYTPHSDIDLHLVVNVPKDEVYQELFNAKKYQYNDIHDIRIRGADVELYVQPADEPAVSLGEYSVLHDKWLEVPKRKRAKIDQTLVRHKYEDVKARIESALKENDADRVQSLIAKIKAMRQAGLDEHGEFGPENLAFKMLRSQGWIKKLYDHSAATKDRELSLKEQPKKPFKYGFGTDASDYRSFFKAAEPDATNVEMQFNKPQDYEWFKKQKLATEDAGLTWDGVSPTTCMFLNEEEDDEQIVHKFIEWAAGRLGIQHMPEIFIHTDPKWSVEEHSFGRYEPDSHSLHVNMANRHLFDILRTTAHELAHCKQNEVETLPDNAGETGSEWENDAHAAAGIIMREFADSHPELFDTPALSESASGYIPTKKQAKDPRFSMALTVDIKPGQVGKEANKMMLDTDKQGKPAMIYQSVNQMHEDIYQELSEEFALLENEFISEIKMSPSSLRQEAAKTGARAGMEFEMLVPGITELGGSDDEYGDREPDLDHDERARSIRDIREFFYDGDYNGRREVERLEQELLDAYLDSDFLSEQKSEAWGDASYDSVKELVERDYEDEIREQAEEEVLAQTDEFGTNAEELNAAVQERFDQLFDAKVDEILADMGSEYDEAYEDWESNDWQNQVMDWESEWLESEGIETMWDVAQNYDITWPYYEEANQDGPSEEYKNLALGFMRSIGESSIAVGTDYHGTYWRYDGDWDEIGRDKPDDCYTIEPDGSLHGNNRAIVDSSGKELKKFYVEPSNRGTDEERKAESDRKGQKFLDAWKTKNAKSGQTYSVKSIPDREMGLEFVSPPQELDKLLADLPKIQQWARKVGAKTNSSTGLHINVSVPKFSNSKLDYVKLALLLGDQYVLDNFGRTGNSYCKAAIEKVKDRIKAKPQDAKVLLDKMRSGMEQLASRTIHDSDTDKYTSINTKNGYIEFRSPGGDWLDENFSKIDDTLLRFVVALDAAVDPAAHRQEYQKKLYKMLNPQGQQDVYGSMIEEFANYMTALGSSGDEKLSAEAQRALIDFRSVAAKELKQSNLTRDLERKLAKGGTGGQKYWWRVYKEGKNAANGAEIELVATTKEEAQDIAAAEWGWAANPRRRGWDAEPVRPYTAPPAGSELERIERAAGVGQQAPEQTGTHTYRVFNIHNNQTIGTFQAGAPGTGSAAQAFAELIAREGVRERDADYQVIGQERQPAQQSGGGIEYRIVNMRDRSQLTGFRAANQAAAEQEAESILRDLGLDPDNYDVRPRDPQQVPQFQEPNDAEGDLAPQGSAPWELYRRSSNTPYRVISAQDPDAAEQEARSALGLRGEDPADFGVRSRPQQQPAPPTGAGREFAGWKVLLPTGEEVYRFSGVGNSQADANRIAAEWLRNNGMGVSGEGFEVVPVWREA